MSTSSTWRLPWATVPALGTIAGTAAWRVARSVDWAAWTPGDVIVVAAGAVGAVAAARFTVAVAVAVVAGWRGRAAPAWVGRAARAAAAGLVASLLGSGAAHAADAPPSAGWLPSEPGTPTATPVATRAATPWTPATIAPAPARTVAVRPTPAPARAGRSPAAAAPEREAVHVVVAGDSLWSISAAVLGAEASDARIAAAWPALYAANRATVGDDPGLIHPGQRLTIPVALADSGRPSDGRQ